jgi:hypothetical protein
VLVGLLLVAIEEVVVGNEVVDVSLVLLAVGDVVDVELGWDVVDVAALVEAAKETIHWQ